MSQVTFLQEPGFVFDLYFIFALHFNKAHFENSILDLELKPDAVKHYNNVLKTYGEIPQKLLPFFALRGDKKYFMSRAYFAPYKDRFPTDFSLDLILEDLKDTDAVLDNLLRFYFIEESDETLSRCKTDIQLFHRLLQRTRYPADVKAALYGLIVEPVSYIRLLVDTIIEKSILLRQQRDAAHATLLELQENFELNDIIHFYLHHPLHSVDITQCDCLVSFSILSYYLIKIQDIGDQIFLTLGKNYKRNIHALLKRASSLKLDHFGSMISDETRQDILDFLLTRKEVNIHDIEEHCGVNQSLAYYHMSVMLKAGVVNVRNQGRTLYYSLNTNYFDRLCEWLKRYV